MNWQDVLLERHCDEMALKQAVAKAFDVLSNKVGIVNSIEDAPRWISIIAEHTHAKGDFRCLLSFYVDDTLASRDPIKVTQRLCSILKVRALISDLSSNPYSMLLINEATEIHTVVLDTESLDMHEEYRLSKILS